MNNQTMRVEHLKTYYRTRRNEIVNAVDGVSFTVDAGQVLGVAGESGCGKSTLALSLMGFYFPPLHYKSGTIEINKENIMAMSHDQLRVYVLGKEIAYIPQSAMNVLNPTQRVLHFIQDIMSEHDLSIGRQEVENLVRRRFRELNLPERVVDAYPIEMSGGMKQRVVIAISTILNPKILIADEPTSALDVSTQKVVIQLLQDMIRKGIVKSMIFITHELPVLRHIADRIMIMYAGQVVETGNMNEVIFSPRHPYTRALMKSIIVPEKDMKSWKLTSIPGEPPNLKEAIVGCRFAERCRYVQPTCRAEDVQERTSADHSYRCIHEEHVLRELYHNEQQ